MKQPIRYFSIGLLAASLILLIVVSFFDTSDDQVGQIDEGSVEKMITALQDEGYHVLTSSEYITLSVATDPKDDNDQDEKEDEEKATKDEESTSKKKKDEQDEKDKEDKEDKEDEKPAKKVHTYKLTIEPNMLGPTVSKLLKDNNIIDDAEAFNRYLETEGYAPYLQLGEHDVSSDMSNYEIAERIAKSR